MLQSGAAPEGTWVFGLPLRADGPLHVRRQPVRDGELLAALSDELTTRFPPPELFVVTFANDSLHLQWTAVPGAASYKVWSSSDAASDPVNYTLELSTGGTHAVLTLPADRMRVFFVTAE